MSKKEGLEGIIDAMWNLAKDTGMDKEYFNKMIDRWKEHKSPEDPEFGMFNEGDDEDDQEI